MARILCTVWPFPGHLYPTIAVAHAARARGHDVAFYSGEAARAVLEGEGFAFFPFDRLAARLQEIVDGVTVGRSGADDDTFYERLTDRYSRLYHNKRLRTMLAKTSYHEWILGTVPQQVTDLAAIADSWRPEVILCDPIMWAPFLVLHDLRRIPVAVFSFLAGSVIPGPDTVPPSRRPRTLFGRLGARAITGALSLAATDIRVAASRTRRRYGLSAWTKPVYALSGRMPLSLVATTPEFDYNRHDLPPTVQYVGACLWDKPRHDLPPDWLTTLPHDQPIVYVTEGTSHVLDATLLRAAAKGLAGQPLQAILTTGRRRDPAALGLPQQAPNIRVERYVPHSDLFPHLSVVVTNGGSGTIRAALAAGIPLVIVPMEWDQFGNAQRVVEAGAGVRLPAKQCTPERLRAAVQQVLADPSFRVGAQRFAEASARCGGPARAAELLEGLVPIGHTVHDIQARGVAVAR